MTATALISRAIVGAALCLPVAATAAPATSGFSVYSFPPQNTGQPTLPYAPLLNVGGELYATTEEGGTSSTGLGTIFKIGRSGMTELYAFTGSRGTSSGPDGTQPTAGLLDVAGILYGSTSAGGVSNAGTVFTFNPATGAETVLHSFGATRKDGYSPYTALIAVSGQLYGTTGTGGAFDKGTVYRIDPASGAEVLLHSFGNIGDGIYGYGDLLAVGSILYGTTPQGGASDNGTVFKIDLATGAESVVYSFAGGPDGSAPYTGLIDVGGLLYGTTGLDGAFGNNAYGGTVFKLDPATGIETVLHRFGTPGDGASPRGDLLNVSGTLYGTTVAGGPLSDGTVFKIDPATGAETILHAFGGTDGDSPEAALIDVGGQLYGTTVLGGVHNTGTVFSLSP